MTLAAYYNLHSTILKLLIRPSKTPLSQYPTDLRKKLARMLCVAWFVGSVLHRAEFISRCTTVLSSAVSANLHAIHEP